MELTVRIMLRNGFVVAAKLRLALAVLILAAYDLCRRALHQ